MSDDEVMKGQWCSAVEIHPLPARRPDMDRWFEHCHNALNTHGFLCLGETPREY